MSLGQTLSTAVNALNSVQARFALIGGFALAAYGLARATEDIDLLVHGDDRPKAIQSLTQNGFRLVHETSEVLHLSGIGQLDLLFANRPMSQAMLGKAKSIQQFPLPVVAPEDIIGLKIQAYTNDPRREFKDKADIQELISRVKNLDFAQIKVYADLFSEWPAIQKIKAKL